MRPGPAPRADYVLSEGAADDLHAIAVYTVTTWGVARARRYGDALLRHFEGLALGSIWTKAALEGWSERQASRCQQHYVFSIRRGEQPLAILAVFHEQRNLPARIRERLQEDGLTR